jgi:hyperosmotically inducible protein
MEMAIMKKLPYLAAMALLLSASALAQKSTGETVDDGWLQTKVKTALVGYGGGNINLEVYRGEVQLGGFVNSETEKKAALAQAESVEGAEKIHDSLYIVEPGRSTGEVIDDNLLTGKVKGALADGNLHRGASVNVEVNRGTVLLSGFVDTDEDRDAAVEIARNVERVKKVINGIDLRPAY